MLKLSTLGCARGENTARFLVPENIISEEQIENGDDMGFTEQQGRVLKLSGLIGTENRVSIGCANAVLSYLQRKRTVGHFQQDGEPNSRVFQIKSVEMVSLKDTMSVNPYHIPALSVF